MNLDFGEINRVKTLVFSKVSRKGNGLLFEDSLKRENISLENTAKVLFIGPIT